MVRPKINRYIRKIPKFQYFKPQGIPMKELMEEILTMDEMEALCLKHYDDLNQIEAAKKMNVSQSTFSRILESAHKKITTALMEGKAIKLFGGNYHLARIFLGYGCCKCNHEWEKKIDPIIEIESISDEQLKTHLPIPPESDIRCPKCKSDQIYRLIKKIL